MLDIFRLTREQVERAYSAKFCHPPQLIQKREVVIDGIATGQFLYFYEVEEVVPVSNLPLEAKWKHGPSYEVSLELPRGRADCACWFFMQTGSICPHVASVLRYEEQRLELGNWRFFKDEAFLSHVLSGAEPADAAGIKRKLLLLRQRYQKDSAWRRHLCGPAASRNEEAA